MHFDCKKEFSLEDIEHFGSEEIYKKFLRFKENIDVELDPNLKWCPRLTCMHFVRREKVCRIFNSSLATCECGQQMCFRCGAVSHPGVACSNVGNQELREYMKGNTVLCCPGCGFGTEKIDGCNHMTCPRCNIDWCWICRTRILGDNHYEKLNVFGCPGGQFGSTDQKSKLILIKFLQMIAIPFILFFVPLGMTIACFVDSRCVRGCNCIIKLILFFIGAAFGVVAGSIALVATPFAELI